jgi:fructose-1,6-bisphosphatase/inositol monophosphatase family enzyme
MRSWGDAYGHALVATGRAEIMVDPILAPWDAAPLLPILVEAGGRFSDLSGKDTIHGGSGVSTNGVLHSEVLEILR